MNPSKNTQNWVQVAYFENEKGTLAATVNFAEGVNYYSTQIGKPGSEHETLSRNIPIRMRGRGKIELTTRYGDEVRQLMDRVEDWCEKHRQAIEDNAGAAPSGGTQVIRKTGKPR